SMLIFNQSGSKSYINIGIINNNMDTSQISRSYEKSPHYLLPAVSKKQRSTDGVDRCINSVNDFSFSKISIYPNPAQSFLKIELSKENHLEGLGATIYGMDGKIALNMTIQDHHSSVDVSNFQAGAYII